MAAMVLQAVLILFFVLVAVAAVRKAMIRQNAVLGKLAAVMVVMV
jgi:hypothetical protein